MSRPTTTLVCVESGVERRLEPRREPRLESSVETGVHSSAQERGELKRFASPERSFGVERSRARLRRGGRGYLLLEVLIGGVMAASVLGLMMVAMVNSKNMRVRASRHATAASIASQVLERARALEYDDPDDELTVNNVTLGAGSPYIERLKGEYTVSVVISPGSENSPTGEALPFKDVAVQVKFVGLPNHLQEVNAQTRIYRD